MKNCPHCGNQYPDKFNECPADNYPLREGLTPQFELQSKVNEIILEKEKTFWERMNFKNFAALMIRIQALWLLFYGIEAATYLPRYFMIFGSASNYSALAKFETLMAFSRIVLYVTTALAAIRYAESILNWLIRDWVAKQSSSESLSSDAENTGA